MNQAIKEWQLFLKSSPLGVSFKGEPNGYFSAEFDAAMNAFESAISKKLNKPLQGFFYYAGSIRNSPAKIQELLPPKSPEQPKPIDKPSDKPTATVSSPISAFKTYLAKNKSFQGPINDDITPEFTSAITRLEDMIAQAIQKITGNRPNTQSLIWSNNQLNTTSQDVDSALTILGKQLKEKSPKTATAQATVDNISNSDPPPYQFTIKDFHFNNQDFQADNPEDFRRISREKETPVPEDLLEPKPNIPPAPPNSKKISKLEKLFQESGNI
jgi:hypothetical protein